MVRMFRQMSVIDYSNSCTGDVTFFSQFFEKAFVGEVFRYNFACFDFNTVARIAERNGVVIEYCQPNSPEYIEHGDATVKVVLKFNEPNFPPKENHFFNGLGG